jgi:2-haloacid dehalogenase
MATMDSIATWSAAAGDRERGLAWRDAVTASMIDAGRYVDYDELVAAAADELRLSSSAPRLLREAWSRMRPWPDTAALDHVAVPYAFVTNCSTELATVAVERSGLRPAFTLAAEEAGWFKPRPEVYALAVERLGIDAGATRFVAGAAYDANGASGSGLPTVFVARRGIHEPLARGIRVVDALTEAVADLGGPEA